MISAINKLLYFHASPAMRRALTRQKKMKRHLPVGDRIRLTLFDILGRRCEINTSVCGIPVKIRSYSSDLSVAVEAFFNNEYQFIKAQDPRIIIDAGANIGTSSIAFAQRFPDAKIYAIEMEKENFALLKHNTQNYPNITPVNVALAAKSGERTIKDRNTGPWGYTILGTDDSLDTDADKIEAISIDDFLSKYNLDSIDIFKMDIEGAEMEIFEAGGVWICATKAFVVELHDRICMGCSRAFYLATSEFKTFERHGEKVCAYRFEN